MQPGPEYIYQCSNCENFISRGSLLSGNTFSEKLYSDGKSIAPMLPEFPAITICSRCKNIFWLDKAKEIGSYNILRPLDEEWSDAEEATFLSIDEYLLALDNKLAGNVEEELYIRLRIWWGFNDRVRNGEELFNNENEKSNWLNNSDRLLELLDYNDVNERIMIADLNRNTGNFKKCLEIINSIESNDLNWLKSAFVKECMNENKKVFLLEIPN